MDSKELLNYISAEDIVDMLVNYYDIDMEEDIDATAYHFRTDCHNPHNEGHFKLYLFKDSKMFHCYSGCGQMSLFDFIMTMEGIDFKESVDFVQDYFEINTVPEGFGRKKKPKIDRPTVIKKEIDFDEVLPEYDNHILNTFIHYYTCEWLNEGITKETMDKYNILFSMEDEAIIIPHYDKDGRLVGIRQRNLSERQLRLKRKYVPFCSTRSRIIYRHPLGKNLYGLYQNKQAIAKSKKCILWESEKSVLKLDGFYNENPSVAVGGSSVNSYQLNLLKQLDVKDIYIAFDYEENNQGWDKKMNKIYNRIVDFGFNCFIIYDWNNECLDDKDSPSDKGKLVFETLLSQARKFEKEEDANECRY